MERGGMKGWCNRCLAGLMRWSREVNLWFRAGSIGRVYFSVLLCVTIVDPEHTVNQQPFINTRDEMSHLPNTLDKQEVTTGRVVTWGRGSLVIFILCSVWTPVAENIRIQGGGHKCQFSSFLGFYPGFNYLPVSISNICLRCKRHTLNHRHAHLHIHVPVSFEMTVKVLRVHDPYL